MKPTIKFVLALALLVSFETALFAQETGSEMSDQAETEQVPDARIPGDVGTAGSGVSVSNHVDFDSGNTGPMTPPGEGSTAPIGGTTGGGALDGDLPTVGNPNADERSPGIDRIEGPRQNFTKYETYFEIYIVSGMPEQVVRFVVKDKDPRIMAVLAYQDQNNDRYFQIYEPRVPGLRVELYRVNKNQYNDTTYNSFMTSGNTDTNGMIGFGDLPIGTYEVTYEGPVDASNFSIQPSNWYYQKDYFDFETYWDHRSPSFFKELDTIVERFGETQIGLFFILMVLALLTVPLIIALIGFIYLIFGLLFTNVTRLGLSAKNLEREANDAKKEALKQEGGAFEGVERFEWMSALEAQYERLAKEAASLTSNSRVTFGAAILFVGITLIWIIVLVYRVFAPVELNFSQAFAVVSPLIVFLAASAYLLRSSLMARQELAIVRSEMNEVETTISKGAMTISSKSEFSAFVKSLLYSKLEKEEESSGKPDDRGLTDNPRILAAIISALGRTAT